MYFRNGLPQSFCPPEEFYDLENSRNYSLKFDSWSLGLMIVELFTGSYLTRKLPKHVECWCLQVYPVIFKILQVSTYLNRLQLIPLHVIMDKEISSFMHRDLV